MLPCSGLSVWRPQDNVPDQRTDRRSDKRRTHSMMYSCQLLSLLPPGVNLHNSYLQAASAPYGQHCVCVCVCVCKRKSLIEDVCLSWECGWIQTIRALACEWHMQVAFRDCIILDPCGLRQQQAVLYGGGGEEWRRGYHWLSVCTECLDLVTSSHQWVLSAVLCI